VTRHEDSDGGWNVRLPSFLLHSAQLGRQSNGESTVRKKTVSIPYSPPQNSHEMACDPSRACAVARQQLIAWVLEQALIKTKNMYLIIEPGLNGYLN